LPLLGSTLPTSISPSETPEVPQGTPSLAELRALGATDRRFFTLADATEHFNSYGRAMEVVVAAVRRGDLRPVEFDGETYYSVRPDDAGKTPKE